MAGAAADPLDTCKIPDIIAPELLVSNFLPLLKYSSTAPFSINCASDSLFAAFFIWNVFERANKLPVPWSC